MIPPFALGRTQPPQATAPAVPLLDRVFPPDQCDPTHGDRWLATLHLNLRRTA